MAIVQNPLIGRASGKFGTGIFYTHFGQNILRTMPTEVRFPATPDQVIERARFKAAAVFGLKILPFLKRTASSRTLGMPLYSALMKSILPVTDSEAGLTKVDTKKALDYFNPILNPSWFVVEVDVDEFTVALDYSHLSDVLAEGDIIDLLFINDTTEAVYSFELLLDRDLLTSLNTSILFNPLTHEYAVYAKPRKFGSKVGSELAGSV